MLLIIILYLPIILLLLYEIYLAIKAKNKEQITGTIIIFIIFIWFACFWYFIEAEMVDDFEYIIYILIESFLVIFFGMVSISAFYDNSNRKKNIPKTAMYIYAIIVPLIIIIIFALHDLSAVKNSNLLIDYKYEPKSSKKENRTLYYAIDNNKCKNYYIDIDTIYKTLYKKPIKNTANETRYNAYYNNSNIVVEISYVKRGEDADLKYISNILDNLIKEMNLKTNGFEADITKVDGTDYLIININNRSFVYKGEKLICDNIKSFKDYNIAINYIYDNNLKNTK